MTSTRTSLPADLLAENKYLKREVERLHGELSLMAKTLERRFKEICVLIKKAGGVVTITFEEAELNLPPEGVAIITRYNQDTDSYTYTLVVEKPEERVGKSAGKKGG